jgi:hypothetical protein
MEDEAMRKLLIAGAMLLLAGKVGAAGLDISQCEFPEPPVVPDGQTATEEEMTRAGVDVREYVGGVQGALECLAAAERASADEITQEQQAELVGLYNSGVDQMNEVAEEYNTQVREYLARQ